MYIEDLDEAVTLRNHRKKYEALRDAARSGSMGDFTIWHEGNQIHVWNIISAESVRAAIADECERLLTDNGHKLGAINVNTACKLVRRDQ